MTLETLETLARKNGSATTTIDGIEFEVSKQVKSKHRRFSYRHGQRHMARDEAERLLPAARRYDHSFAPGAYGVCVLCGEEKH